MYNFNFHAPDTLDAAIEHLKNSEDAALLAGGQTLLPTMKQRLAAPSDLVSLSRIPELKGIQLDENRGTITIGANETHADVAESKTVKEAIPALAYLAGTIGDPLVRHMGTLGGSIANNDPSADYPAALLALGAKIVTDRRSIDADDFFLGIYDTSLQEHEIVVSVIFPLVHRSGYAKLANPASRYATVGVFVAKTDGGVRVAVTGAGPGVFRATTVEAALSKSFSPDVVPDAAVSEEDLSSDMHASAEYRAALIPVIARRAVVGSS